MRRCAPLFAAALLSLAPLAKADLPLVTDDGEVPERGACKLESGYQRDRAGREFAIGATCVPFGIVEWGIAYSRFRDAGEPWDDRFGVQAKIPLVRRDDDDDPLALALLVAAARTPGLPHGGSGFQDAWANVAASLYLMNERLRIDLNAGLAKSYGDDRVVTWGVAADYEIASAVSVVGEVYRFEQGRPRFTLGGRWHLVPDRVDLELGAGRRFGADDGGWLWTVGIKVESPTLLR